MSYSSLFGIERTISDIISVLLDTSRLKATVYANPRTSGDWVLAESALSPTYHLVVRGSAWLHVPRHEPAELAAGDLAVMLRGERYLLAAGPVVSDADTRLPEPDGRRVTELVCGRFDFGDALVGEILEELPDVLVIGGDSMRLEGIARLLSAEAAGRAPGRQVAMDRLSDLLFIALIRHLMEYKKYKSVVEDLHKMEEGEIHKEKRGNIIKELKSLAEITSTS